MCGRGMNLDLTVAVKRLGCKKKAANRGIRERSPKQDYLVCDLGNLRRRRRKASLYKLTCAEGDEPGRDCRG
jgi:hypothetical protein